MELEQVTRRPGRLRAAMAATAAAALLTAGPSLRAAGPDQQTTGVLILAHGGAKNWNEQVAGLSTKVDAEMPTEVAFGMADRAAIQAAVDRLAARGVSRIVTVPLFVSSHSSVFTSSQYLLGARAEAPEDLAMFAKMSGMSHGAPAPAAPAAGQAAPMDHAAMGHGSAAATSGAADPHAGHGAPAASVVDNTKPVTTTLPITVGGALDHSPVVSAILTDRAKSISRTPAEEVVIVVAHGPVSDEENALWVKDMTIVAQGIQDAVPFARVEALTVRDDAPKDIRDAAAQHLRDVVTKATGEGHRVLIVPLLMSFGGIEAGVRKRLDGLQYEMATQGLLPDDRLAQWVLETARAASNH